jgi:anti-sigma factor RsiW
MKDDHIIKLIEEGPLSDLSATEIERVNAHTAQCAECLLEFQAAIVSSRLLKERASATVEPSPFFHTRTLAAIRERGRGRSSAPEPFGFWKMWQAARFLIASMAAVVVMLTLLTLLSGRPQTPSGDNYSVSSSSVDLVFDDDSPANDDLTYSQVLTNLYNQEAEGADGNQQ